MNEEDYHLRRYHELMALHINTVKECLEAFELGKGTFDMFKSMVLYLDFIHGLNPETDGDLIDGVYARHYSGLKEDNDEG